MPQISVTAKAFVLIALGASRVLNATPHAKEEEEDSAKT